MYITKGTWHKKYLLISRDIHHNPGPSNIIPLSKHKTDLLIINLNSRSISNKLPHLYTLISHHCPDILTITETWLKPSTQSEEILPPEYNILGQDRLSKKGGGIAILYKNTLTVQPLQTPLPKFNNAETLGTVLLLNKNKSINILSAYIPPGNNSPTIEDILQWTNKNLPQETILLGDLNLDWLTCNSKRPTNHINLYVFSQLINEPTRVDKKS